VSGTFAIVDLKDGERRDKAPFLLDNDAFPVLENAYLFRGRIQRRSAFATIGTNRGRLRWLIGTTNGAGGFWPSALTDGAVNNLPGAVLQFEVENGVSSEFFTDQNAALPDPVIMLSTLTGVGTLNRTAPANITIAGSIPNANVWYYPGLPVMGLRVLETVDINDEKLIAFDTRYSYLFDIGSSDFIAENQYFGTNVVFVWTGSDSDFFYTSNYRGAFWATNNVPGNHAAENATVAGEGDGIRWLNPTNNRWLNFNPIIHQNLGPVNVFLWGGLIILPYKDRLLVLSTWEATAAGGAVNFKQRARWSQNGTPFYASFPTNGSAQADAWRDDVVGKGGYIDAPTAEAIIAAEFIKDTLVVYFERSTWQLVYTANETLPFVWQKINTELGCESTFSIVPFDRGAFAIGNYGAITCDSVNVIRIDQKIPDEIFRIQNQRNGVKRVYGIRDYNAQLVYWTYPVQSDFDGDVVSYALTFPNQVLVYNYLEGSWAEFDDCFTCFGYWQSFSDKTWADFNDPWEDLNFAWNSQVTQARYPDVIAGNQRGFVFVFSQLQNLGKNSPSLEISNITIVSTSLATLTVPSHNLTNGQYITITDAVGVVNFNNEIFMVVNALVDSFQINAVLDPTSPTGIKDFSGTYKGGGLIVHLPNFSIQTKEFNPFYQQGDSVRVNYVDFYAQRTTNGQLTAQFYTNSQTSIPLEEDIVLTSPEPSPSYSSSQDRIFHRIYSNSFGSFFQNIFTLSDTQMRDINVATSNLKIHALIYYVAPAGRLSYDV